MSSFDHKFYKDFRNIQILSVGLKLADLLTKNRTFFDSFFDSLLTTAVFTQNKAVAKHSVSKSKNIVQELVSLFLFKVTENDSICH